MNKKIFLFLFLILPATGLFAQERAMNSTMFDTIAKEQILIGYCNRAGLNSDIFGQYFNDEYKNYSPDHKVLDQIRKDLMSTEIVIVMATWCDDSRQQVGRFYKILDSTSCNTDQVRLICVDKKKKGGPVSLEGMDIQRVPTFIVYRAGKEIGRIVESPKETLEKDLLTILSNKE